MARLYKKAELFSDLKEVGYMREAPATHGDSTLAAAAAAGATTITVVLATNFVDGDYFFIGSGESQEIAQVNGAPAGAVITVRSPLALAHIIGELVKEVTR